MGACFQHNSTFSKCDCVFMFLALFRWVCSFRETLRDSLKLTICLFEAPKWDATIGKASLKVVRIKSFCGVDYKTKETLKLYQKTVDLTRLFFFVTIRIMGEVCWKSKNTSSLVIFNVGTHYCHCLALCQIYGRIILGQICPLCTVQNQNTRETKCCFMSGPVMSVTR